MMAAIHQPHYFPWLGYLAKMARVDKFILMDTVQLEKNSYMIRNRIVDMEGKIKYLTISAEKHGFMEKEYREIKTKEFSIYTQKQKNLIYQAYKECKYFNEVWNVIVPVFTNEHEFLCDTVIHSIDLLRDIFMINTPLILQSNIKIDSSAKKGKIVLELCKAVEADVYCAGRGSSMQYLNLEEFEREGVHVTFQNFQHPIYTQIGNHPFMAGLSALDLLFNKGIVKSREIFWSCIEQGEIGYGGLEGV